MTTDQRPSARRLPLVALLFAASNLLSAGLGYVRESVIAWMFGNGPITDAYFSAFRLPDLLNYFLAGGALSIAFLPRYTRLFVDDPERADRFLGIVLGTFAAAVTLATVALELAAEPLVALLFPHYDPPTLTLTVHLTRIVLPAQIFFVTGGVIKVALFARDRYLAAALAPVLYNVGIILGGLVLGPRLGIEGFAWGVLAGAAIGAFGAPLIDAVGRLRWHLRFAPRDRDFLAALWLAIPLMLGVSLLTVDEWYLNFLGPALGAGTVSHLLRARSLMRLPVQVVGQALGTAALPTMARLWAEGKGEQLNRVLLDALRAALALGLMGGAALLVLATPITTVLFERGAFDPADTRAIAAILTILAAAVPFWLVQQITLRGFYARSSMWPPTLLGSTVALAALPLYLIGREGWGTTGLAVASASSMAVTAMATLLLARRHHGAPIAPLLVAGLRAAGVAAIAAIAAHATLIALAASGFAPQPRWLAAAGELLTAGLVFVGIGGWGLWRFGDEATRNALQRLVDRLAARLGRRDP